MTKKEKLKFVLEKTKEMQISAYDIAKNTTLTEAGVGRILNGTSKNPQENSLNSIITYLETKQVSQNYTHNNSHFEEPNAKYTNKPENDLRELLACRESSQKLLMEVMRLQSILRKSKIDFDDSFEL